MSNQMKDPQIKTMNTMNGKTHDTNDKNAIIKRPRTFPNPKPREVDDIVNKWSQYRYQGTLKRRSFHLSFLFNDYLYVIGGTDITEGKLNSITRLKLSQSEVNKWELNQSSLALERIAYAAGVLCEGEYYIIGGQNQSIVSLQRIVKYIINKNEIEHILIENNAIPPLDSHTACLFEKKIYLFGGNSIDHKLNDVFLFDIENYSSINVTEGLEVKPAHRNEHSAVIVGNEMYIHGGMSRNEEYLDDLWKYTISDNKWTQIELNKENSPIGRIGHTLVLNQNKIFLFGGMTKIIRETNELWVFDTHSEENGFVKIHDNIIEVEETIDDDDINELGQSGRNEKKKFRLLNHSEVEKRTNPNFYSHYASNESNQPSLKKVKRSLKPLVANTEQFERTLVINNELKKKPNVSNMKNSNIFTLNKQEANLINEKLKEVNKANIPEDLLLFQGLPPTPRNGHSALLFGNKLLIIGGDRNKMAFNDIYCFDTDS